MDDRVTSRPSGVNSPRAPWGGSARNGTCPACRAELSDPRSRRYRYPFLACPECGPGYTVTTRLPFARVNTTFAPFEPCEDCWEDFENPNSRHFGSPTVCCPDCGPSYWIEPAPPLDDAIHDLNALSNAIHAYARDNDGFLPRDLGEVLPYLDGLKGVYEQQPGRIFLTRHHEAGHDMDEAIDPNWILENTSYTYLGDGRVRLQELRHAYVGLLLHGPIAEPLAWTTTDAVGQPIEVVPYAPPMFARVLPTSAPSTHAYALPAETVALMATDSRNAIKRAAGDE